MFEQEAKNGVEGQLWKEFNDDDLRYWDLSFNGGNFWIDSEWNNSEWNESSWANFKSISQSVVSFTNVDDSNQMERNIMLFHDTFTMIDKNNNVIIMFKGCLNGKICWWFKLVYTLNVMVVLIKKQIIFKWSKTSMIWKTFFSRI